MIFECEMCHSFADDGDILNKICLNCIDNMNSVSSIDCGVSNSININNSFIDCN